MADLTLRRVEPEILDGLAEDDSRAIASRRDLVRINRLMFQPRIMAQLLENHVAAPRRILEIGAGDGSLMLNVTRRLARRWPEVELTLLDRADLITRDRIEDFARLGWRASPVTADIFDWIGGGLRFDAITANLFLHHFNDADLRRLFAALRPLAPVFLATEPRRSRLALVSARSCWAIGANEVTRHDAPASVRAGFTGSELSRLWPGGHGCVLEERRVGPFTHVFAASSASMGGEA